MCLELVLQMDQGQSQTNTRKKNPFIFLLQEHLFPLFLSLDYITHFPVCIHLPLLLRLVCFPTTIIAITIPQLLEVWTYPTPIHVIFCGNYINEPLSILKWEVNSIFQQACTESVF